jgi:hypothetical protein
MMVYPIIAKGLSAVVQQRALALPALSAKQSGQPCAPWSMFGAQPERFLVLEARQHWQG